ncbi:MAG TPA: hypothetical protein VJQ52_00575 [Steroidobacteraceae bacterium]|nr:hypothetical protein [Steroidobacteraceae bacterium]
MNHRAACEHSPRLAPHRRRHSIAIALLSLALAACSAGSDSDALTAEVTAPPAPSPGGGTGNVPAALDCTREGYPCSFDAVPLPVIERSLSLSDEAAQQLESGADIEQVAAFLDAQSDVADVTVDGPVLGFRVAGGRPMIVDVTGDQEFLANAPAADAAGSEKLTAAARKLSTVRSALSSKLVGGGNTAQRRALVLSPFRYEQNFGNAGELIAEALNGVRGYAGNVTYLATTNELDPQVTVDVLTRLDDYQVIHIDTHGGTLCKKKETVASMGLAKDKDKKKCADGVTDFLVQRFHGTAADLQSIAHPGIVHYRGRLHQSIAVTADFFRHYYPDGLVDKLFILGSCNTYRTDMADAIAGSSGVYVSWDGYTEFSLVKNATLALLQFLGRGLTVGEAFARMPAFTPENPDAQGSTLQRTSRRAGGDLRIRDLITVRDNLTGKLVSNASGVEVREVPGDGLNDHLDLEFTVDGISPEQLANFYVNLVVNDKVIGHLEVARSGVQVDEFRYQVSTPVPLPFDVQAGQTLNMDFWIPLPDLGEDHFVASPSIGERAAPQVGSQWVLTSSATQQRTDDVTVKTASVIFEIEPDDDPEGRFHYFRVRSGTLRIQRDYEDALGCRFNVDYTIDIPAGAANNYLKFDAGSQGIVLEGFGSVPSRSVPTTGSCGDSASVSVGGVYFVADETPVSGGSLQGGHNDGAAAPTIIEWSLARTE